MTTIFFLIFGLARLTIINKFRNFIKNYEVLEVFTKNQAEAIIFTNNEKEVGL